MTRIVAILVVAALVGCEDKAAKAAQEKAAQEAAQQKAAQEKAAQDEHEKAVVAAALAEADARRKEEEEKKKAAAKAKHEALLADIHANPRKYLTFDNGALYNKGIVNDYAEVTALSVTNKSPFSIRIESAMMNFFDSSGRVIGAAPVTFAGAIAAGETKHFSKETGTLTSGTIEGKPSSQRLEVSKLEIIETAETASAE